MTDIMQSRETASFFALTDVEVYDLVSGQELFRTDFIDVNRSHIVMLRPLELPASRPREGLQSNF